MAIPPQRLKALLDRVEAVVETAERKDFDAMRELIDRADVVYGIFEDPDAEDEAGLHIIKGHRTLMTIASQQKARAVRTACISCRNREEAVELQRTIGEPDALN